MAKRLTWYILGGLVLGIVLGWTIHAGIDDGSPDAAARLKGIAGWFSILTTVFLRLIKMIIAPLVFSTLVVGIAHMGDTGALGRVGLKSVGWFIGASLVSLTLGLLLFHLTSDFGDTLGLSPHLTPPPVNAAVGLDASGFDVAKIITHIVPSSIVDAMATNEILQIVIFSAFFGVAITAVGERAAPLVTAAEGLAAVMLQITDYVMRLAPIAVFSAITAALTEHGPGLIFKLAYFMGSVYFGLATLWIVLGALAFAVIGRRAGMLLRYIREPALLAFSTASSEAAFPRTLEALDRFGVPAKIASFVLPLGYSFNLDGSMMYMTFASLFIAKAYGIQLTLGTQIAMLLTLMVTSKGIAGVPRASLVVIAATLGQFGIPEAGLLLIIGVDQFLDMGRSATNVVGNAIAASVVARWEGDLEPPAPAEIEPPHAPSHGFTRHA
ncbi:dicarboxylate/amino acid:cation symporter [Sphingomonas sp. NFR15]|uniref:dicarboxylate/amino acid:cation symporter n=1 Tax=Sphingomonas sp. NFR15 TaxID=1566282 RepID=UPI0008815AF6|nr:dicarboxylate/amino acid:cation symporter [Sphingomonas sp. NFR15]SDA12379.1 Na+/H+-dicarboxylate symporter [Sphingomonas sp. NFR15]